MDIVFAAMLFLVLLPFIAVVAVLIRIKLGSPALFNQERPGLDSRTFRLYKFRTMSDAKGPNGELLPDRDRLGSFGRCLRRTSVDEWPTLWNVLKGDMSLVGPRPLLVEYLEYYSPEQARRHEVRPGITGWAQVNGRNSLSWQDKFKLDVWYVDNWSLAMDFKILLMTVKKVITRDGITHPGEATMPRFRGNE